MADMLVVECRRCGTATDQLDGPTMMGFNPRCLTCGTATFVSITELLDSDPPGTEPASHEAWEARESRIPELAGKCGNCGGGFSVDAPLRCTHCRSRDISTRSIGNAC